MHLNERQWKNLSRDLQLQRCVLFLGNRLATGDGTNVPLTQLLAQHLANILDEEGVEFEKSSADRLHYITQRFMTIPKIRRTDLEDEVEAFYRKHATQIPQIYRQVAQLPFSLIINTTPDDLVLRAFHSAGKTNARQVHYNFRRENNPAIGDISPDKPLIYNLWGALADPESLVLSQEDRVDFIKNVVRGNPAIPNPVMGVFDERKTYVFLGLNLENWDARLLLECFKLSKDNITMAPQSDNYPLRPETRTFFEDRYHFVFVEQEMSDFVDVMRTTYDKVSAEHAPAKQAQNRQKKLVLLHDNNELDRACCQKILSHLAPWLKEGWLTVWHPGAVLEGDTEEIMRQQIAVADAIVPILSVDFVANDQNLIATIQERHRDPGVRVVSILHRTCHWAETPLAAFQVLPDRDQPLRNWPDEDHAYTLVAERLKSLLTND